MPFLRKALRDERGATSVEYALFAGFMSINIILGAHAVGTDINGRFEEITDVLIAGAISVQQGGNEHPDDTVVAVVDPVPDQGSGSGSSGSGGSGSGGSGSGSTGGSGTDNGGSGDGASAGNGGSGNGGSAGNGGNGGGKGKGKGRK